MDTRLTVPLDMEEREALYRAAQADLRPVREQARWFIRHELERRGLLPSVPNAGQTAKEQETSDAGRV
jgi:hypothetical protein